VPDFHTTSHPVIPKEKYEEEARGEQRHCAAVFYDYRRVVPPTTMLLYLSCTLSRHPDKEFFVTG
jgi:hypothetical protein